MALCQCQDASTSCVRGIGMLKGAPPVSGLPWTSMKLKGRSGTFPPASTPGAGSPRLFLPLLSPPLLPSFRRPVAFPISYKLLSRRELTALAIYHALLALARLCRSAQSGSLRLASVRAKRRPRRHSSLSSTRSFLFPSSPFTIPLPPPRLRVPSSTPIAWESGWTFYSTLLLRQSGTNSRQSIAHSTLPRFAEDRKH